VPNNDSAAGSKPRLRFLPESIMARAVMLVMGAMAVWWFVLKGASLWLLRCLAFVPLGLLVAPGGLPPVKVDPASGDWLFNVAVNATGTNLKTGDRQYVDSLEFAVGEDSVAFFTCGWFAYLGLALSVGTRSRSHAKSIAKGIALQTGISVLCLAAYVYINGYGSVINTTNNHPVSIWLIKYAYHLIYLVIPFAGPFAIALLVHPEWRAYFAPERRPSVPSKAKTLRAGQLRRSCSN
jgi:hypothetical protein